MTQPNDGDHVRLTLTVEGTYDKKYDRILDGDGTYWWVGDYEGEADITQTLEVIEPPVEIFTEGKVRHKSTGNLYTILPTGWYNHDDNNFVEWDALVCSEFFTSKHHERVDNG